MSDLILAINPLAASTRVGLFRGGELVVEHLERHPELDSDLPPRVANQLSWRARAVKAFVARAKVKRGTLAAAVGRGGLLRPVEGGTYLVDDAMLRDAERAERGDHAANLGAALARAVAEAHGCPAYVVDPISVDELDAVARFSGLAGIPRSSMCHALTMRAVARRHAEAVERPVEELRLVVAHLGTGISLAALRDGRLVDVLSPADEGPFSANRAGRVPASALVAMCFEPGASADAVRRRLFGQGGLLSYLGTGDVREAEGRAEAGDGKALVALDAMAYQTAKAVGELAAALIGEVDAVLLTGGAARATALVNGICRRVEWIAPVFVYPGDDELGALAAAAWRVLRGQERPKQYG